MPSDIPFTLNSKSGTISRVSGAASNALYHIMIEKLYHGQLWKTEKGWRTDSEFDAEELGRLVENQGKE